MQIQSPLSNLRDVLSQAKNCASKYGQQFRKDEAGTRLALIDPVISALGWQLWNPEMVRVESTSLAFRADYILLDPGQSPHVIVEAKPLGAKITSTERGQLFSYAAAFGASSAFITNGSEWEHYEDPVALNNHALKFKKDIAIHSINEIATYLIQRLDAANVWPKEDDLDIIERRLAQVESDTQTLLQKSARTNSVVSVPPAPPPPISSFIDLSALPDVTGTRQSQLRLPDNTVLSVNSWSEVLVECCKFSLSANHNILLPLPDKSGQKVNLLNLVQLPRTVAVPYNGSTIYVRRLYDAQGAVANSLYILALASATHSAVKAAVVYGLV